MFGVLQFVVETAMLVETGYDIWTVVYNLTLYRHDGLFSGQISLIAKTKSIRLNKGLCLHFIDSVTAVIILCNMC